MIELKVGDRVRVYGNIKHIEHPNYFLSFGGFAEITYIYRGLLSIKLLDGPINIYECHRKQVRKLVKVKKCNFCKGLGLCGIDTYGVIYPTGLNLSFEKEMGGVTCPICKGKGKVKA